MIGKEDDMGRRRNAAGWTLAMAVLALLLSCGGAGDPGTIVLAREVNYLQCQESLTALAAVDRSLADAGVQVLSKDCASDGLVVPAVCGITVHYLRTVEIAPSQEPLARSIGFRSPGEFDRFLPLACPAQ